jgi:hypothetical protein
MKKKLKVCFYKFQTYKKRLSLFSSLARNSIEQNLATENELDEFLIDLVKKHGLKTIQKSLKPKK